MIRAIAWVATGAVVVGAVTFASLTVLGVDILSEGEADEPVPQGGPTGDLRLWSTRDNLAVCVETGGELKQRAGAAALQSDIRDSVEATVTQQLTQHPDWSLEAKAGADSIKIESGCPADAHLDCPEGEVPIDCAPAKSSSNPIPPSQYRLFVFVLSEDDLQKATAGIPRRPGMQEVVCWGDLCQVVTYNLYLTDKEAENGPKLETLLAEGLFLEEPAW